MTYFRRFFVTGLQLLFLLTGTQALAVSQNGDGQWLRQKDPQGALIWGRRDGIIFGLPSPGGIRGPRGLIRVGILGKSSGEPELINFIAIEPVTKGAGSRFSRMGFSELEMSELDTGKRGKRLWVATTQGELTRLPAKPQPVERLSVRIEVEPFTANRAHVYVVASMYSDRPRELELTVYTHDDSAPVEELTVTATMGNYERLRHLWLKDRVIDSRELYAGYSGNDFVDKKNYPRGEMLMYDGDALVLATTNEDNPSGIEVTARPSWTYRSIKLTQYWRVPARHIQPDLRVKVNGRRVYWASKVTIPGGLSFENFEVRQRYVPGQAFVFGLTPKHPWEFSPSIPRLATRPK